MTLGSSSADRCRFLWHPMGRPVAARWRACWLVDPAGFIERWSGSGLGRDETIGDRLASPLLARLEIEVP